MNTYQIAKHDSNKLIVTEAKNNAQSAALVPTFKTGIDKLETYNTEVERLKILQSKDTSGVTTDTEVTSETLVAQTEEVAGAVHSYAYDNTNNALMAEVNYSEDDLEKMTRADLITAAGIVFAAASKLAPADLAKEGISADQLKALGVALELFKGVKSAPREAIIDRTSYTSQISEWLAKSQLLLKKSLDRLAVQFKTKDPEFYKKYKAARHVIVRSANKPADTNTGTTPAK
jgi:hypothetical protein